MSIDFDIDDDEKLRTTTKFESFLCEIKVFNHMQTKSCTKKGFAFNFHIWAFPFLFDEIKISFLLKFSTWV